MDVKLTLELEITRSGAGAGIFVNDMSHGIYVTTIPTKECRFWGRSKLVPKPGYAFGFYYFNFGVF